MSETTGTEAYIGELAKNNGLIKEKPDSQMRLSVVVPMYAEYENGNVFRLIESFSKQTGTPPSSYEIICAVNNTPEAARNHTKGYEENQHTLAVGRYLKGEGSLPEGLNEYRKSVLEKAKEKGLILHMLDFSTSGMERNIGKVRDTSLNEAIKRFQLNGQGGEGIIAQLDADTVLEPRYVDKILKHFSDPNVESLFVTLDYFTPEGTEDLFQTSFHHQYKIAFDQWINTLGNSKVEVGGPQTVARAKAYQRVGGIVHQDMTEDFRLAESLSNETEYKFATDTRVYTSDRARDEGYDARMRLEHMNEEDFRYKGDMVYLRPRVMFLKRELEAVAKANPDIFDSEEKVKAYFDKYEVPFDYTKFRESVLEKSSKTREGQERPLSFKVAMYTTDFIEGLGMNTSAGSNEYVDDAIAVLKKQIRPEEITRLDELVRQNSLRATVRLNQSRTAISEAVNLVFQRGKITSEDFGQSPKTKEFIERNSWLLDKLNALPQVHHSSTEAMEELKTEFPEWMETLEKSRLRRGTALMHALTAYFREARNNPNNMPETAAFLQRIER